MANVRERESKGSTLPLQVGTDKDYLASTIAYRLDLHGTAEASVMFSLDFRLAKAGVVCA